MANQNALIPVKLDAFVFNKPVCDSGADRAKISPITQPNYSFLRLSKGYLQSDIMHHIDLHNAWPASQNSRFTDLGTFEPFRKRQGIYLHWTMPLVYRSGTTSTTPATETSSSKLAGITVADKDETVPTFPNAPSRWLVIRKIDDMSTVEPSEAQTIVKKVTCWVVESDRRWQLEELDEEVDLQVDVSPFIYAVSGDDPKKPPISLDDQAEVFIGEKIPFQSWVEAGSKKDRVDLKLLSSSNQLFPDYQPHCSNVFSMLDNFEYAPEKYLTHVDASYYVVGWNWKEKNDLFFANTGDTTTRSQRLSNLKMEIKGSTKDTIFPTKMDDWLKSSEKTQSICHGAMYNVKWDVEIAPENIPGDKFATVLNGTLPVAVGTTPLDALTTYAEAHKDIEEDETPRRLEKIINKLEKYLLARDDGVETQFEAADLLYNWNYARFEGGQRYYVSGGDSSEPSANLPRKTLNALTDLNRHQVLFDALARRVKQLRWKMFSEWWKYCILPEGSEDNYTTKKEIEKLDSLIKKFQDHANNVHDKITEYTEANKAFLPGTRPTYYQQRDPTFLVGGIKSGWEADYLDPMKFRLDSQVIGTENPLSAVKDDDWSPLIKAIGQKMPPSIAESVKTLVNEFALLETNRSKPGSSIDKQLPLFHDQLEIDKDKEDKPVLGPWRDLWNNTQPWFPLFLEWEVEYVHIPYDTCWKLEEHAESHGSAPKIHYRIDNEINLEEEFNKIDPDDRDTRTLSGRVLILPQPSFSLEAKIRQFFDDTPMLPPGLKLDEGDENFIKNKLRQLGFISAPLAGFTSHIVTLEQGNHIKPILKVPQTGELKVIPEALRELAGFEEGRLAHIGIESDVTPYGTSKKPPSNPASIFKPVSHGQFRFTKLNVIDKFGQAITAIDPRPSKNPQKVWPCISDWFKPHPLKDYKNIPNVVKRNKPDSTKCEYIQVPPTVNQPSRLNGAFVVPDTGASTTGENQGRVYAEDDEPAFWRPMNEWDKPLWGWVVVNYANNGVQIFLADGTFYREIRLGQGKSVTSPEWIPFKKPSDPNLGNSPEMQQLALLVAKLADNKYLEEFVGMINSATLRLQSPPSAYSEFASSLIGRPLALVNMGWSLELASNELTSQLAKDIAPERRLLPETTKNDPAPTEPADPNPVAPRVPEKSDNTYKFHVKFGDKERGFDGMVGYFNAKPPADIRLGDSLDLDTFYTHYSSNDISNGPPKNFDHLRFIGKENYPLFENFFIEPVYAEDNDYVSLDAEAYERAYNREISKHAFGALIDPFSPVHAYTGVLPVKEVVLPNWTWQTAIDKMKAFFHAGPVIVVKDVPPFNPSKELTAETPVKKVEKDNKNEVGVQLPSVSGDHWAWLQPYMYEPEPDPTNPSNEPSEPPRDVMEKYMGLSIDSMDQKARLEDGPYTALEGYLQLADPPKKQ